MTALKEISHMGSSPFNDGKSLENIFTTEVVGNERMAWYVDYFLMPNTFKVRHLAVDAKGSYIPMTNENKEENRDPNDLENTQWAQEDVALWFRGVDDGIEHRWILLFNTLQGDCWGLHVEANRFFAFGPSSLNLPTENLWSSYVEDGILGPIKACNLKSSTLFCLVADPDLFGALKKEEMVNYYMLALAGFLDDK